MTRFLKNGYFFFLFFTLSMSAQKKKFHTLGFLGFTNDVLLMDDVEYMCSISPLSDFDDYKTVFGNLSIYESDPESPVETDKNYQAKWRIYDGLLYLYDVEILEGAENYPNKHTIMEKLTSHTFQKFYGSGSENFPAGRMFASWFSGYIYIKRQPSFTETFCDCMYRNEKFKELRFYNGQLSYERVVDGITAFIDSMEIMNRPKKYEWKHSDWIVNPCEILLRKSLSLADDEVLYENFYAHTCDIVRWGGTECHLSISPLSVFENYKNIYKSNVSIDKYSFGMSWDKNYDARWIIQDYKLYLCDDIYIEKEVKDAIIGDSSIKVVEELIGKKFLKIPSYDKKVIFADWYSGTLFFKRPMTEREDREGLFVDYQCEPLHKITLEKGRIISWEQVQYMTYKYPKRKVYNTQ